MVNKKSIEAFYIGVYLLLFCTICNILTVTLLFLKGNMQPWYLIITTLITTLVLYKYTNNKEQTIKVAIISIILISLFIFCSGNILSGGWDGEIYHKPAVGMLKDGWNPIYQSVKEFTEHSSSVPYYTDQLIWSEVYPKATWFFGGCIYSLTNNIETGKATTLIFMAITFCLFYGYLSKRFLKKYQALIISSLVALNPISINHIMHYYLDGVLVQVLSILLLLLFILVDKESDINIQKIYPLIFCTIIWGCNLKFSGLFFTAIYCITFFGIIFFQEKSTKIKIKNFAFFGFSAFFSIFYMGYAPYITNILRYKNPFYGIASESNNLINTLNNQVPAFSKFNNFEKFIVSFFCKMEHRSNELENLSNIIKIPFTFQKSELDFYYIPDAAVGGMGILFGGCLIISIIAAVFYIIKKYFISHENVNNTERNLWIAILILLISMGIIPATHQARYIGHVLLIPIVGLITLMNLGNRCQNKKNRIIYLCSIIIFNLTFIINIIPYIPVLRYRISESQKTKKTFEIMEKKNDLVEIILIRDDFIGLTYNLDDYNLNYILKESDELDEQYSSTYYNWISYKVQ